MLSFRFQIAEDSQVQAYSWIVSNPSAILQITHGMMEHAGRYDHFARWLNEHQISVYASDHIGHGLSVKTSSELGHFPYKDDWQRSVNILHQLTQKIRNDNPGVPVFLLGHSMGSVMTQTYMIKHGNAADGYILSGTVRQSWFIANIGLFIAGMLSNIFGPADRSKLLVYLGYGQYNNRLKPHRTAFDWICSAEGIVDEYIKDPICGFPCSNRFYRNFFYGFRFISKINNLRLAPAGIPVYIFAGRMDPAGKFGKDPVRISYLLTKFARADVQKKIYPEGRHEMLNEMNREDVYRDLLQWIENRLRH